MKYYYVNHETSNYIIVYSDFCNFCKLIAKKCKKNVSAIALYFSDCIAKFNEEGSTGELAKFDEIDGTSVIDEGRGNGSNSD